MKLSFLCCSLVMPVLSFTANFAVAHETQIVQKTKVVQEAEVIQEKGLKSVMQGLLKDTQALTEGIFLEDYKKIEAAAKNIANHPTPGTLTMRKVMAGLGAEMGVFKGFDMKVHDTALVIANSASEQNMSKIISGYHQMIDGCQSCHAQFKPRVSKIINPD